MRWAATDLVAGAAGGADGARYRVLARDLEIARGAEQEIGSRCECKGKIAVRAAEQRTHLFPLREIMDPAERAAARPPIRGFERESAVVATNELHDSLRMSGSYFSILRVRGFAKRDILNTHYAV